MHPAYLEGNHDVLRLAVVLPWERSKEFMNLDLDAVPDCPIIALLFFEGRELLPLLLGKLLLLLLQQLIEHLQRFILLQFIQDSREEELDREFPLIHFQ